MHVDHIRIDKSQHFYYTIIVIIIICVIAKIPASQIRIFRSYNKYSLVHH